MKYEIKIVRIFYLIFICLLLYTPIFFIKYSLLSFIFITIVIMITLIISKIPYHIDINKDCKTLMVKYYRFFFIGIVCRLNANQVKFKYRKEYSERKDQFVLRLFINNKRVPLKFLQMSLGASKLDEVVEYMKEIGVEELTG